MTEASKRLIIESLKRTRRMYLIAAIVTLPTALAMLLLGPSSGESTAIVATAVGFGVVFLATAGLLVYMLVKHWRPERAPLMRLLCDRPDEIVWIYVEQINSNAAGIIVARSFNIKIALADKKLFTLAVKASDKDRVLAVLGQLAPQATFGFSRELQQQYKRDPHSLATA